MPLLGESQLHEKFHLDEAWDSPHNKTLIARIPNAYQDPSGKVETGKTVYLALQGPKTIFEGGKGKTIGEIRDGTANTILLVEVDPAKAVEWTKPEDFTYDSVDPLIGLRSRSKQGFHAAFADGSVRFISNMINPQTFLAMLTATGDE